MRRPVLLLVLAVLLAACGGAGVSVQQAPGPPVTVDEPGNPAELAPTATPTATAGATGTATPTATATGTTGTTGTAATPTPTPTADSGTGTGTQTGSTGTTQPPPAGSDAQKFEQFCAQNPGAC